MPICPETKERLLLDLYGELDSGERSVLQDHLKICGDCRREREKLTTMLQRVKTSLVPPPLSARDSAGMVRAIHRRLGSRRRAGNWLDFFKNRPTVWIPAAATVCLLFFFATFIGVRYPGTGEQPPVSRIDISKQLPEDEVDIIKNLDLLKNLDTLEKLSQVVDDSGSRDSSDRENQGVQKDYRHGNDERTA